jgi:hypothetical protein
MTNVKFKDVQRLYNTLFADKKIFGSFKYSKLHKFLSLKPVKNKGINFCGDNKCRILIKEVFKELHKNWLLSKGNVVITNSDSFESLRGTIKTLKTIKINRNFSLKSEDRKKGIDKKKQDFADTFLKCIICVLRYEKLALMTTKKKDEEIETKIYNKKTGTVKDKGFQYQEITQNIKSGILLPKVEHIKQGKIGDCYLSASLMAIAKSNKNKITKCFINKDTIDKDKCAKIRLFKVEIELDGQEIKAVPKGKTIKKVQKTLLQFLDQKSSTWKNAFNQKEEAEALWVNLIEKAFMLYKSDTSCVTEKGGSTKLKNIVNSWYSKKEIYKKQTGNEIAAGNIAGGMAFIAIAALTGETMRRNVSIKKMPINKKFPPDGAYPQASMAIYRFFKTKTLQNKIIAVSTKSDTFKHKTPKHDGTDRSIWVKRDGTKKDYAGLFSNHAYAIVEKVEKDTNGVDRDGNKATIRYIWIQNPHLNEGFLEYIIEKGKIKRDDAYTGGKLKMELNDFLKYFKSYDVMD